MALAIFSKQLYNTCSGALNNWQVNSSHWSIIIVFPATWLSSFSPLLSSLSVPVHTMILSGLHAGVLSRLYVQLWRIIQCERCGHRPGHLRVNAGRRHAECSQDCSSSAQLSRSLNEDQHHLIWHWLVLSQSAVQIGFHLLTLTLLLVWFYC